MGQHSFYCLAVPFCRVCSTVLEECHSSGRGPWWLDELAEAPYSLFASQSDASQPIALSNIKPVPGTLMLSFSSASYQGAAISPAEVMFKHLVIEAYPLVIMTQT